MAEESNDEKVYMLNALWFLPEGGKEKYKEYLRAAGPIVQKYGARKLQSFYPVEAIIGEFDPDLLFVVEWPDIDAFETFVNDPDYAKIRHLREEALERSLLIRCRSNDAG